MERNGAASIKRVEGGASLLPAAEPAAPAELGRPAGGALECRGDWRDIADTALCSSSGDANAVLDALVDFDGQSNWFVLVGWVRLTIFYVDLQYYINIISELEVMLMGET